MHLDRRSEAARVLADLPYGENAELLGLLLDVTADVAVWVVHQLVPLARMDVESDSLGHMCYPTAAVTFMVTAW